MRLKSFLGLTMTVAVLSMGLASTSGCTTTITQGTPVTQTATETPVTQPTTETTVTQTTTETTVTQPTTETTVTQPTTETTINQTTTETTVTPTTTETTGGPLTESQLALLADIRSKAEQPYSGIYSVDAVTAKKLLDETQAVFLDARYLVDYDVAHISGAISLPVSSVWNGDMEPKNIIPDREVVYIGYCSPGCPAGWRLARELYTLGYRNLFVLDGGYLAWQDAGYPMDTE